MLGRKSPSDSSLQPEGREEPHRPLSLALGCAWGAGQEPKTWMLLCWITLWTWKSHLTSAIFGFLICKTKAFCTYLCLGLTETDTFFTCKGQVSSASVLTFTRLKSLRSSEVLKHHPVNYFHFIKAVFTFFFFDRVSLCRHVDRPASASWGSPLSD